MVVLLSETVELTLPPGCLLLAMSGRLTTLIYCR